MREKACFSTVVRGAFNFEMLRYLSHGSEQTSQSTAGFTNRRSRGSVKNDAAPANGVPACCANLGGTTFVTSGLTGRNETKEFFLSYPQIDKLEFQGIPETTLNGAQAPFASWV